MPNDKMGFVDEDQFTQALLHNITEQMLAMCLTLKYAFTSICMAPWYGQTAQVGGQVDRWLASWPAGRQYTCRLQKFKNLLTSILKHILVIYSAHSFVPIAI